MATTEHAPAKLNLFLHIIGKRDDGYHELLTHVVFTEFGDRLSIKASDLLTLSVKGEFADACRGEDNLVLQAARLLQEHTGTNKGAHITLEKNIPVGAGLGGGSADAAATLRALNRFWKLKLHFVELMELAEQLGADVPMCLHSKPLFASGIGEEIALHDWPDGERVAFHIALVYPRVPLLTTQVFANVTEEEINRGRFTLSHGYGEPLVRTRNDLQRAAIATNPIVGEVLLAMETAPGATLITRMTGSGSCCFALLKDAVSAQAYAAHLRTHYPQWWVQVTKAEC